MSDWLRYLVRWFSDTGEPRFLKDSGTYESSYVKRIDAVACADRNNGIVIDLLAEPKPTIVYESEGYRRRLD